MQQRPLFTQHKSSIPGMVSRNAIFERQYNTRDGNAGGAGAGVTNLSG